VLDTGRYTVEAQSCNEEFASLTLASPPDARTGIQIVRRFTLGRATSRVQVELTFRNISTRTVRWAIWDVMQIDASRPNEAGGTTWDPNCMVTTPLNPHSRFERGFNVMFGNADNPQWQTRDGLFRADYLWEIGKVGIDSQAGWIAFSNGSRNLALVETFTVDPAAEYPDSGATVECWTVGAGQVANLDYSGSGIYLMETEVLSPFHTIAPGGAAHLNLEWAVCSCSVPIVEVQPAGCISAPLQATWKPDTLHVTCVCGIFDAGKLIAHWGNGEQTVLGIVSPNAPLQFVDQRLRPPSSATSLTLAVRADRDGVERHLAHVDAPAILGF
jgi:hypothetical protein